MPEKVTTDLDTLEGCNEMLRLIFDNVSDLIAVLDADGRRMYNSPSYASVLANPADLRGTDSFLEIHPEDRERIRRVFLSTIKTGRGERTEYRFLLKDGTIRYIESHGNPIRDAGGRITRVVVVSRDVTERKTAEHALQESETRIRTVVANSPIVFYAIDSNGIFTFSEGKGLEAIGLKPGDAVGTSVFEMYRDVPQIVTNIRRALKGEVFNDIVAVQGVVFDSWYYPIFGLNSEVTGVIGVSTDVTERTRGEKLQEAVYRIAQATDSASSLDELYRSLHTIIQEVMPANNFYIALYDEKENLIRFPYFVDEVDVPSPPQKPGKGLTAYVLRTGKPLLCTGARFKELIEAGEAELIGVPSPIWLGVPLIVDNRTLGVMVVQHYSDAGAYGSVEQHVLEFVSTQVARAIERKSSAQYLLQSEERYRRFFEEDLAGNYITSPDGRFRACNSAFLRIFGFTSFEEAINADVNSIYPHAAARTEFLELIRNNGRVEYYETELRRRDGSPVYVIENATGTFNSNGELLELRGHLVDISERKKLEDQLIQSQKMEAVGQLASGIAHDFNNVMSVVLGATHLIKSQSQDAQVLRFTKMIEDTTLRGTAIAKQLLQFSRSDASKLVPISLSHLVLEVNKLIEHSFLHTILVELHINLKQGVVMGDAGQLHQMLLNLCINARDAIAERPQGTIGGKLILALEETSGDVVRQKFGESTAAQYVVVRVSDNGMGIPEEVRHRIFEPFFTTKGVGKGTGLGLSIAHGIMKSHHGFIEVDSTPGKGTTFFVYLPAIPHTTIPPTEEASQTVRGGTETILVIEDEEALRELVKETLVKAGYSVVEAKDGEEGVSVYRDMKNSISLVLSDMGLPRLSGEQVFVELKKIDSSVKVFFCTGYIKEEKKADLLRSGAVAILQKPYVVVEMLRAIRSVLDATVNSSSGTPGRRA